MCFTIPTTLHIFLSIISLLKIHLKALRFHVISDLKLKFYKLFVDDFDIHNMDNVRHQNPYLFSKSQFFSIIIHLHLKPIRFSVQTNQKQRFYKVQVNNYISLSPWYIWGSYHYILLSIIFYSIKLEPRFYQLYVCDSKHFQHGCDKMPQTLPSF